MVVSLLYQPSFFFPYPTTMCARYLIHFRAYLPSCLACSTLWPGRRYQKGSCWCGCVPCWGSRWWRTGTVHRQGMTGSSSLPVLDSSGSPNWTEGPGWGPKTETKEKPQDQSRTINQITGHSLALSVSALQIYHFETFHNHKFSHMSTLKPEVV